MDKPVEVQLIEQVGRVLQDNGYNIIVSSDYNAGPIVSIVTPTGATLEIEINQAKILNGHLDFSKIFKFNKKKYWECVENNRKNGNTLPDPDQREFWE